MKINSNTIYSRYNDLSDYKTGDHVRVLSIDDVKERTKGTDIEIIINDGLITLCIQGDKRALFSDDVYERISNKTGTVRSIDNNDKFMPINVELQSDCKHHVWLHPVFLSLLK